MTLLAPRFLLFFALTLTPIASNSADIRAFQKHNAIVEGEIVAGDFDRFVKTIDSPGMEIDNISVYSKGGNVTEAIAIGTLIRELRLHTTAPRGFGSRGNVCPGIKEQSNCTCLSACVLVFVGGVHRYGNVLGVHRSYVSHDVLKAMSGTEAISASTAVMRRVDSYLNEMAVPRQVIDIMNSTSSQEITFLEDDIISRYLSGYIPQYGEFMLARCGNWKAANSKLGVLDRKKSVSGLSSAEQGQYDALMKAVLHTIPLCESNADAQLRNEVFTEVIASARKRIKR